MTETKRLYELAAKWRADGSYNCHACSSDMHARALCADELEATLAERAQDEEIKPLSPNDSPEFKDGFNQGVARARDYVKRKLAQQANVKKWLCDKCGNIKQHPIHHYGPESHVFVSEDSVEPLTDETLSYDEIKAIEKRLDGDWQYLQEVLGTNDVRALIKVALAKAPASITHADWELLAVSDLAPYVDERYEKPRTAENRGYWVLAQLHKTLFGTFPDGECRECK